MSMQSPQLKINDAGELVLETPDGPRAVRAARSFPWTSPEKFIVLRDASSEEVKELVTIPDLAELPPQTRSVVEEWLERHTFIPTITRVLEVRSGNTALLLHLETNRGQRRIKVMEREDLRPLTDGRTLVRDVSGVVYVLPPIERLDQGSQEQLRLVL